MTTTRRSLDQQHSIVEAGHCYGVLLDTREIFIYGEVDGEGELGNSFVTNMRILLSKSAIKPIVIHQHSLGGDWCTGMMIFDSILSCPAPIIFVCHGLAASMGSIIPMSCIKHGNAYIVNMPNCDWLIHDGTTDISDGLTMKQARSWAVWEERNTKTMREWYVDACSKGREYQGKNKSQIRAKIKSKLNSDEDWWLTSREAVDHGFADAVLGDAGFESIEIIKNHWI